MHLEGTYTFNTTQEKLWDLLNDPDVLTRATPGIKELQPQGDDKFQALFEIKMGPINSNFDGTLEVVDKVAPESCKLLISVDGKIGTKVTFDKVLYLDDGKNKTVGTPLVSGINIDGEITSHGRERKVVVFKFKRRKGYQKKNTHRQEYSMLKVGKLGKVKKSPSKKSETKATETKTAPKKAAPQKAAVKKTTVKKKKPVVKKASPEQPKETKE